MQSTPTPTPADAVRSVFRKLSDRQRATFIKKAIPAVNRATMQALFKEAHIPPSFQGNRIDRWLVTNHQERIENALLALENELLFQNLLMAFFRSAHKQLNEHFLALIDPEKPSPKTFDQALTLVASNHSSDPFKDLFLNAVRWICEDRIKTERDCPRETKADLSNLALNPNSNEAFPPNHGLQSNGVDWAPLDADLQLLESSLAELRAAKRCDLSASSAALERANRVAGQIAEDLSQLASSVGEVAPSWSTREDVEYAWQRFTELAASKERENQQAQRTLTEIVDLLGRVRIHHRLPRKQEQLTLLAARAAVQIGENRAAFLPLLKTPAEPVPMGTASLPVSLGFTWILYAWAQEGAAAEDLHQKLEPISPALAELLASANWSELFWPEISGQEKTQQMNLPSAVANPDLRTYALPSTSAQTPEPPAAKASEEREEAPSGQAPIENERVEAQAGEPTPVASSTASAVPTQASRTELQELSPVPSPSVIGDLHVNATQVEKSPTPPESLPSTTDAANTDTDGLWRCVWRLTLEGRLGLASHLATLDKSGKLPPGWIFEAALLGPRVNYELSPTSERLSELFLRSADLNFDNLPSTEQPAARLLLAGAALRPALLAPQSNAASALKLTELKDHLKLSDLDAVVEAVAEFGLHREPLQPAMLRSEHDRGEWEEQLARVRLEIRGWVEKETYRNFNFAAATRIWRDWTASGGKLRRLLDQTANATQQSYAALESAWEPWRTIPDELVQAAMKDIKQRMTMVGSARETLLNRIGEAVELANRLFALMSQAPRHRENFREEQVRALLDAVQVHGEAAAGELERLNTDGASIALSAASKLCQLGLKQLNELLRGEIPLPGGEEANPRWLVDAELLRDTDIALATDGPIGSVNSAAGERLRALAASAPDWPQAWQQQTDAENHAATAGLLEFFRWQPQPGIDLSDLRSQRSQALESCRRSVEKQADSTGLLLDEFAKLGLCPEKDYLDWSGEVEAVKKEALVDATIQFASLHSRLAKVRTAIERAREREATKVRERLAATPRVNSGDRQRIIALLETGDVHTATDYLDRASQGIPLPEHAGRTQIFSDFFGENGWLAKSEAAIRQSSMHDCWQAVRDGCAWNGLNFQYLGQEQRIDTAAHLQLWINIERQKRASDHDITQLVTALGLQPLKAKGENPRPGRTVAQRCDVLAERLEEREAAVVASFGSGANGKYTLHLVWGEPNSDELINLCRQETGDTRGQIIVCFRFLFQRERRELAEDSRKRFLKAVVVDRAMFAFLCAQTGARFATLLRTILPFARVEPYTISAGAVPPEIFYGRRRELESLADPRGSCFVYGGRQLGKTALLRALQRRFHQPDKGRAAVFVDLKSELFSRGRPVDDLWTLLVSKLKEANVLGDNVGAAAGHEALFRHIREWLDKESERRLLLLLDESDSFLEQDEKKGKEVHQHEPFPRCQRLKNLMETTDRRFKVVFAGLHNVQRTTRVSNHPLAHFGEAICVGPMLEEAESREARALVEEPLAAVGYFFESPDAVSRILALTNYYPSLIQLFCHHLLADLRENHVARFSHSCLTPPFTISSYHVQAAYGNRVRQAIHEKVNLTLHLDSRYELIAYLLAFYHASEPGRDGLDLRSIRDEVYYYWPKGFEEMRTDDEFRSLLEEMVGLGILRQASGTSRFALRNPNVMMLLGTDEEIARRLENAKEWEPALRYEADKFRRIIAEHPRPMFSPLTAQSEGELRASENRVAVVYGLPAGGLRELQTAMESDGLFSKARTVLIRGCTDPSDFFQRLGTIKREPPHTLALVPSEESWDESWIAAALRRVEQLTSKDAFLTVLFVADAQLAPTVVPALNGSEDYGVREFSLRPWHDAAVRQWLQDLNLGDDPGIRQRIRAVTGNWPVLLSRLSTSSTADLRESCDELENQLGHPTELLKLKAAFGVDREASDSPLHVAAESRRFTTEWVCQFLEISEPGKIRAVADRLQVAEKLGIVTAVGSEWEFDPIAGRILLSV